MKRLFTLSLLLCLYHLIIAQSIQRFEHFNSQHGLSQNTVFSIYCDNKGFLWIGTWNGLNRYDGHEFKTIKNPRQGTEGLFTNNRISRIWGDKQEMIWMETYDHFYHYFNPKTETIETLPAYSSNPDERNSVGSCFLQYSDSVVLMGSTNSGAYLLEFNAKENTYATTHFLNRGKNALTNHMIRFIYSDEDKNIWIGTDRGINYLPHDDYINRDFDFQHLYVNVSFSNSVNENANEIWFGTNSHGILAYNKIDKDFKYISPFSESDTPIGKINQIESVDNNNFITSFENHGVHAYNTHTSKWTSIEFHGNTASNIYIDHFANAWITTNEFGITKVNLNNYQTKYYELTKKESDYITDLERPFFFEDSKNNLWIGLHGSGLALFNRQTNAFVFYKNNPKNTNSIASNIVHCIAEDDSGLLWLGTGQYKGGLEKVVFNNSSITHIIPEPNYSNLFTNVVRAMMQDSNENLWVASKSGKLYLYNKDLKLIHTYELYLSGQKLYRGNNIYSILQSKDGYIWLGSKGEGLGRSNIRVESSTNYKNITFDWVKNDPTNKNSLGNNNVYSITEDKSGNLWIGTFGNGLSLLEYKNREELRFKTINKSNSTLSSNAVRHILIDSNENIWIATTFGLNFLHKDSIGNLNFQTYLHSSSNEQSISYNDVIHILEDSKNNFWFTTFGGGANMVESITDYDDLKFNHFSSANGLSNDVVFGTLEDNEGKIWFSSENGLFKHSPENSNFEAFNENNGLNFNNFSENTCIKLQSGELLFGGSLGFLSIDTKNLKTLDNKSTIELTNFLLLNEEVSPQTPNSPLKKSISFAQDVTLQPYQSSFAVAFSSLDFLDPNSIQYAYYLEELEEDWNYVGNQNKATYTSLSPGRYTFHVKSTDRNGKWNETVRSLNITILPPWYRTKLAYLGAIILLIIIIVTISKIRSQLNNFRRDLLVEKKVNALKLKFFTNISHEIRTPLTLILGPIDDLLQLSELTSNTKSKLKVIRKNARRMLKLTNQLLDFRKVQNNKMKLKVKEMDVVTFTKDIFTSFEPLATHKGIIYQFESRIEEEYIWADDSQLDIIIYNLLSNALKFTESNKKVTIQISKNTQLKQIEIAVIDEGKGIPTDSLNEIFTRYTILSDNELSGTGIGLSLSYELAKLHGGEIKLKSEVNKGSTFTLIIPEGKKHLKKKKHIEFVKQNDEIASQSINNYSDLIGVEIEEENEKTDQSAEFLALIVEDNQEILNYICQSLRPQFNCLKAENGEEALKLIKENNPDIIITDIMMPVMDGIEMTKQLKTNFDSSHIPVIMLTAKTDIEDQIGGIEIGAEAYISKPFNTNHLKTVAKNLIKQRRNTVERFKVGKNISPNTLNINSKDEDFLKKLVNYVEENHSKEITIDQLAEFSCLSRTVFYNKVKGLTGCSPIEFLRQLKLKIAAQLLEKGFNVSEVAFQIGFNDVKYFSRQFKALFGHPPSKHNQIQESKNPPKTNNNESD